MSEAAAPILIVGAGPTGLSLAIELQRRGVPFRLIERAAERSDKSRALAVQARSLELMRAWGVADELVARGQTTQTAHLFVERHHSATVPFGDIGVDDTPYPFLLFVSQVETERACEQALEKIGGRVERPVTLLAARDRGDTVVVKLQHRAAGKSGASGASGASGDGDARVEEARFSWVVGCDGAHSVVQLDCRRRGRARTGRHRRRQTPP